MGYEMVAKTTTYQAVRFHDAGRERWLIVRSGDTAPVVVAEALGQSTGVLIAEAMNDEIVHTPSAAELYDKRAQESEDEATAWNNYYAGLTPLQQIAEIEAMDRHAAERDAANRAAS